MAQPFNFFQPSGAHTRPRFTTLSIWQSSYFLKEEKGAQRKTISTPQPAGLAPCSPSTSVVRGICPEASQSHWDLAWHSTHTRTARMIPIKNPREQEWGL